MTEKERYVERMFKEKGVVNLRHDFNFEGIAARYGGTALYIQLEGLPPPIMANAVEFPSEEIKAAAWEDIYKHLNEVQDSLERGEAEIFEFGDSTDPNFELVTDEGKLRHVINHRGLSKLHGDRQLSKWEAEMVEKGLVPALHSE